jgi:uroporphyrinogen decarboxylase
MAGSRKRFFQTVRHEQPDRVPLDLWIRPEVLRELKRFLDTDDVETALGIDFARVEIGECVPGFEQKAGAPRGGDWPGASRRYIWHDERTLEDAWGVVQRVGSDGKLLQWIAGPFAGRADVEAFRWPDESCLAPAESISAGVKELKAADRVVLGEVAMPFKRAWHMRGLENLLCDMLGDREFVERLYDRIYAFESARAVRLAEAGVDCIMVVGDIAMERRLIFRPELFRELDVPRLRRMIGEVRRVRPDALMFYHSDGDISAVMDDLIFAGFDIINPIQPECMDPEEVKRRWGDRITLWGTISVRTTLPQGTPDAVRATVRDRIRRCGTNGGLVIAPANVIMYDTPVENVVAMYEAAREPAADANGW